MKLFNKWRVLSEKKPKKDGWYLCTVELVDGERRIEQLYWYGEIQQFKNKQVVDIYSTCDVYAYNRVTHEYDILVKDYISKEIHGTVKGAFQKEDIPTMAKHAAREANPLYPVPVLMNAKELETFYEKVATVS